MAAHYHIGAMHPFDDGNGRTARALEAFMLRRQAVNDMVMVSLSNYYYEHRQEYLAALYDSRQSGHDLTPFLTFALPCATPLVRSRRGATRSRMRSLPTTSGCSTVSSLIHCSADCAADADAFWPRGNCS